MSVQKISNAILGVGVDDTTIDLFESQYPVPTGVSYNSYVILDEKVAILDTVDNRATDAWLANLTEALGDRMPEYLVVSHMEPDHGANIARLAAKYPDMKVVGNAKTFVYMEQFFGPDAVAKERRVVVKDGESLSLGSHTLTFVFAPMVHWPEVMVSYESSEKVLFSADGFGRFGAVAKFDEKADWASEARRYYLNIVGKYGPQVQALLKRQPHWILPPSARCTARCSPGTWASIWPIMIPGPATSRRSRKRSWWPVLPSTAIPAPRPTPWPKSCVPRAQRWWRWT